MKSSFLKILLVTGALIPKMSFAAASTLKEFTSSVVEIIGTALIPLIFSAALALFIWGVFSFIQNADSPDKRKTGKQRMLWGIIALFVMVAYMGLTSVVTRSFFSSDPILPQLFDNN